MKFNSDVCNIKLVEIYMVVVCEIPLQNRQVSGTVTTKANSVSLIKLSKLSRGLDHDGSCPHSHTKAAELWHMTC